MEQPIEDIGMQGKARRFITQCIRVLTVTKKPDKDEFKMLFKISALGVAVIGMIGFLLFMLWELLTK